MPTTLFVMVNAVINAFRMVDHAVVTTRGGPDNATSLLLFYIYEVAFKFWDTAYGATLTIVLLAILAAVALGQFLYLDRRVPYRCAGRGGTRADELPLGKAGVRTGCPWRSPYP